MSSALDKAKANQLKKSKAQRAGERHELKLAREDVKGAGQSVIEALVAEFSPEDIATVLKDAMSAEVVTKGGSVRKDHRTQVEAVKLYLSYAVGTPVQRQEQVNYNMDMSELDDEALVAKLAESPAMLSKVKRMIAEAEAKSDIYSV